MLVDEKGQDADRDEYRCDKPRPCNNRVLEILDKLLNAGGMNDGVQQQTHRVYENMTLLALDLFPRIVAVRINAGPPFSALFTLWLSMMQAVGLASRSAFSRHST
jgi:hypothetical protein